MKVYRGMPIKSETGGFVVTVGDSEDGPRHDLDARRDLMDHSSGFNWGYPGSAPTQLALALLADALDDDARALQLHHRFTETAIADLPFQKPWALSVADVMNEATKIERERNGERRA